MTALVSRTLPSHAMNHDHAAEIRSATPGSVTPTALRAPLWPLLVAGSLLAGAVVMVGFQAERERRGSADVEALVHAVDPLDEHVGSIGRGDDAERAALARDIADFNRAFDRLQGGSHAEGAAWRRWTEASDRDAIAHLRRLWERTEGNLLRLANPAFAAARGDRIHEQLDATTADLAVRTMAFAERQHRRNEVMQRRFFVVAALGILGVWLAGVGSLLAARRSMRRGSDVLETVLRRARAAEGVPAGLVVSDGDFRLQWCNEAFARRVGEAPTALRHRPVLPLLASELDTIETRRAIRWALERGEVFERDSAGTDAHGHAIHRWVGARTVPGDEFGAGAIVWLARELSDAEMPKDDAEPMGGALADVVRASSTGFVLQGRDGRILQWNPAAERILGLTANELGGRTSRDPRWRAVRDDGSPYPEQEHPAMVALATGHASTGNLMGIHRSDGRLIWISIDATPLVRDGEREPYAVATAFADVTAGRQAEAVAHKLRRAVDQNPIGIVITDAAGSIEYANPPFERLSGYPLADLLGRNPRVLSSGETPRGTYAEMWSALRSGEEWRGVVRNRRRDGSVYVADLAIFPLRDEAGRISHYVAYHQDADAVRATQEEADEARRRLAEMAHVRARFLQDMSRELLVPLESITRTADDLLRCGPDRGPLAGLQLIRHTSEQVQSVIHQLFDLSWMEAPHPPRAKVPFRLRAMIRETLADIARDGRVTPHAPGVDVDPVVPDAWSGDAGALRHLLSMLIGDAVFETRGADVRVRGLDSAGPVGSPVLSIEVLRRDVRVSDDRRGRIQRALADPFAPAAAAELGAVLAARLARHLGGELRFEPQERAGDVWRLHVPLEPADERVASQRIEGAPGTAHVLVLDARSSAVHGLRTRLESLGFSVTLAAEVADAPTLARDASLRDEPCDVLLVDGRGGVLDPFATVDTWRASAGCFDLPVLVLTDAGGKGDATRCQALGVRGYLAAPFGDLDLAEAVVAVGASSPDDPLVTRHSLREVRPPRRVLVAGPGDVAERAVSLLARAGYEVVREVSPVAVPGRVRAERFHAVLIEHEVPGVDVPGLAGELMGLQSEKGRDVAAVMVLGGRFDARWVHTGVGAFVPLPLEHDVLLGALQPLTGERSAGRVNPAGRRDEPHAPWDAGLRPAA